MTKVLILVADANPDGTAQLSSTDEVKAIQQGLDDGRLRDLFDRLRFWPQASVQELISQIQRWQPHIVHFSAHGTQQDQLYFVESVEVEVREPGEPVKWRRERVKQPAGSDTMAQIFRAGQPNLRLIVLNACYSAVQAKVIAQHIDYVVGIVGKTHNRYAEEFACRFYGALANDVEVEEAIRTTKLQLPLVRGIAQPPPEIELQARPGAKSTVSSWVPLCAQSLSRKASDENPVEGASQLSKARPPAFPHRYPLQSGFTGREQERAVLSDWLLNSAKPILVLSDMGGMGKSALAWVWLHRDVLNSKDVPGLPKTSPKECDVADSARLKGVLWWSFYEDDGHFTAFLDTALIYLTGRTEAVGKVTLKKINELVQQLDQDRILLVLDGFERELAGYQRLNATYKDQGNQIPHDYRSCTLPEVGDFLRKVAAKSASRLLITTRHLPLELDQQAGCLPVESLKLAPHDAIAFVRSIGEFEGVVLQGTDTEIEAVCRSCGYHCLSLSLLARMILRDLRAKGDIDAAEWNWKKVLPKLKGTKQQCHILELAYRALDKRAQVLLSSLAAYRTSISNEKLFLFRTSDDDERFEKDLDDLTDRGFLSVEHKENRLSIHPVVRAYAYEQLETKVEVHKRLANYFRPDVDRVLGKEWSAPQTWEKAWISLLTLDAEPQIPDQVDDRDQLVPLIECYHHTLCAGDVETAFRLCFAGLGPILYHQFADYHLGIELLRGFCPEKSDWPDRLTQLAAQTATAIALANCYSLANRPGRAVAILKKLDTMVGDIQDPRVLAVGWLNLACQQIVLGQFKGAENNLQKMIREAPDEFTKAIGRREYGRLLVNLGKFRDADQELNAAKQKFHELGKWPSECIAQTHLAMSALLAGKGRDALRIADQAHQLAVEQKHEHDLIRAEWLLGAALLACADEEQLPNGSWGQRYSPVKPGQPAPASDGLTEQQKEFRSKIEAVVQSAISRCRRVGLLEMEPDLLLNRARWQMIDGDRTGARRTAEKALEIADRIKFRIKQAEAHVLLARLDLEDGNRTAALDHAHKAKAHAWCDGPPHCYQPALEEAERLLRASQE